MYKVKLFLIVLILLFPARKYGQYTDQINSNRPGESMSAYSVGKSVIQIETGVYGIQQEHSLIRYIANGYGVDAAFRYGLLNERLELIADLQYQREDYQALFLKTKNSALKQTVLGLKYLIYDPFKNYERKVNLYSWKANQRFNWHQLLPAISIYAGANYFTKDNPYYFNPQGGFSPKVSLITQNHLGDGSWVLVSNTSADYIGTEYPSYSYVVTLTKGINNKWSGFVENQGYKSDFYSDLVWRAGAAYLLNSDLQVDASISSGTKQTPSIVYGGVGISWRYDAMHVNKRIAKEKPSLSKSEKKAQKKAEKAARKKNKK